VLCKVCYPKRKPIGKKALDSLIKATYNTLNAKQSSTLDFTTCKTKKNMPLRQRLVEAS